MLRAVLLDVDGTLVDSNDAHARSWQAALREAGVPTAYLEIRRKIGMGGDRLLPAVSGISEESPVGKKISAHRIEIFRECHLPGLQAFPGTRALLERMRAQGLRLVAASSADEDLLHDLLRVAGVSDLIDESASKADAASSKPAPDIVTAALENGGLRADEVLMLGDTPYDIQAARLAGVDTVALLCGGWEPESLSDAAAIYRDPQDLLERYSSSPFTQWPVAVPRRGPGEIRPPTP